MNKIFKLLYVPTKEYAISFLKWLVLGVVVGIIGGAVGTAFAKTIGFVTEQRLANGWLILLLPLGGILSVAIYKIFKVTGVGTNQVFERIYQSELFVMTSEYEGMPNALIEAMCLGLPVISTKVSGATDIIEDGVNGFLVDCRDEVALERIIRNVLAKSELRKALGSNAAKLSDKLSVEVVVKQWLDFIECTVKKSV